MITRLLAETIVDELKTGKVLIIYGPRQVGKTTLLKMIFHDKKEVTWINGDNIDERSLLETQSANRLASLFKNSRLLIIDEAQRIENIGLNIKIIHDQLKIPVIATGSSSFDLANKINEPLTGRKFEHLLLPFSFEELAGYHGVFEETKNLPVRLIFGSYPEVVLNEGKQIDILKNLTSSYLYKDILEWNKIKNSRKLIVLLQAIAFQLGSEVSYNELAQITGLNKGTVESYIDLLEKSFVIFTLHSFSRNHRNELKKSKKIYFYDNGIRNALINNFNPVELRNDTGALWENYIIGERLKFTEYRKIYCNRYFWRTKYKQEIDYIEECNGQLYAYEFKWSKHKKSKIPKSFIETYPDAVTKIITPDNYIEFISKI